MPDLKTLGIQAVAASGLQNLFSPPAEARLTTLLFHRFAFAGESWRAARDRLRRQLEWLCEHYTPVSLTQVSNGLTSGTLPRRPILVTVDDARIDMLEVAEEFQACRIPVGLFVCVGWTAQASPQDADSLLARVVSVMEWYQGPDVTLTVDGGSTGMSFGRMCRADCIDALLTPASGLHGHLVELAEKLEGLEARSGERGICTWDELKHLQGLGVDIGSHSVSHVRMALASPTRLAFEVIEGKRLLEAKLGACPTFAYPFGTADAVSETTTRALQAAGFQSAFLTHSEFASTGTDRHHIPRLTMPDENMSLSHFRARVVGGGIPFRRAREFLKGGARTQPDRVLR